MKRFRCHYCECTATMGMGKYSARGEWITRMVCEEHRDLLLEADWDEVEDLTDA